MVGVSDAQGDEVNDPLGLFPGKSNAPGNTRTFVYDGRDLLTAVVMDLRLDGQGGQPLDTGNPRNPDGRIAMRYRYDLNARRSGVTDDNGSETLFAFDALDRVVEKRHADGTRHMFTYDRDGNMKGVVDPNGSRITQVHDALDRLVSREVVPGPGVVGTTREVFEYDGMGRLVSATDNNGADARAHRIDRAHDSLSHVLEEAQDSSVHSAIWSGDGKIEALVYPGGRRLDCEYDEIDRALRTSEDDADIATSEWIGPTRRLLRRTHGNASQLTFLSDGGDLDTGYDEFLRIRRLRHERAGAAFVDRTYAYNRADQRLSEERGDDAGATDAYTYDSAYRIVASAYAAGGAPRDLESSAYVLDGAGNRREETAVTAGGQQSLAYDVNTINEYTARAGVIRRHDANGNLTDDGTVLYAYDWRNRLVAVDDKVTGAPVATYEYDVLGRRVKKTVFDVGRPGT
ncbi:MAG: hypothetical protein L0206_08460, partial [Actinobacteria bacterium]|nr:hypothetical protein [Actinomycetota bacterium]